MLIPPAALSDLSLQLHRGGDGYRFAAVAVDVTPLDFVRAAAPLFGSARYLAGPDSRAIGGVGTAWRATAAGPSRFAGLADGFSRAPALPPEARMLLGFSFTADGPRSDEWGRFPASEVVLPTAAVIGAAGGAHLVVAIPPGADPSALLDTLRHVLPPDPVRPPGLGDHAVRSVPPTADWCTAVAEVVGAIAAGSVGKVVLARSVVVETEMTMDPFEAVAHLAETSPRCHMYVWQVGGVSLVGASPELLVSRSGSQVRLHPLAGSAGRGIDDAEDREMADALLHSAKDREEHAYVVDDIAARLGPVTEDLDVPPEPAIHRAATVQHLGTEITGTLRPGVSLFDLAGRLHPTPAVGGTPQAEALAFIDKLEAIDRGWYSGGVGWVGPAGDGDIAIALRCALMDGSSARLYAGNGIVVDSDPQEELVETRWKFLPLLNLLTVT